MSGKPKLKLDWCSHEAAKYAVMHWHYSRKMPVFKKVCIGVWEKEKYIGCIIFSNGARPQIASPFNLRRTQAAELTRVALRHHETPVSRIVRIALAMVKKHCPLLRIVISYADPEQGHAGIIYQAGNWYYLGETAPIEGFVYTKTNKVVHTKTIRTGRRGYATQLKRDGIIRTILRTKLKYVYPFDEAMRTQIEPLRQPYPKRAVSETVSRPAIQPGDRGSTPTAGLRQKGEAK